MSVGLASRSLSEGRAPALKSRQKGPLAIQAVEDHHGTVGLLSTALPPGSHGSESCGLEAPLHCLLPPGTQQALCSSQGLLAGDICWPRDPGLQGTSHALED